MLPTLNSFSNLSSRKNLAILNYELATLIENAFSKIEIITKNGLTHTMWKWYKFTLTKCRESNVFTEEVTKDLISRIIFWVRVNSCNFHTVNYKLTHWCLRSSQKWDRLGNPTSRSWKCNQTWKANSISSVEMAASSSKDKMASVWIK